MAKPELRNHRKFVRLRRLLKAPLPHVLGYLECLWQQGYQTGDPCVGDSLDVEAAVEYSGEPGTFTAAAFEAGFLDANDDGTYSIHDLYEHAPQYVQKRMKRLGTAPNGEKRPTMDEDGYQTADYGCETDESVQHIGEPRTENQEPKEENTEESPEPAEPASVPVASPLPVEIPVLELSCVGNGPKIWPLTASKVAEWADSYPGVDVVAECRKARQWLADNPTKRKTFAGMAKFLGGWLGRCQDRPGSSRSPPPSRFPTKAEAQDAHVLKMARTAFGVTT